MVEMILDLAELLKTAATAIMAVYVIHKVLKL